MESSAPKPIEAGKPGPVRPLSERLSAAVTHYAGSNWGFAVALLLVLAWLVCGPIVRYSETRQLAINTSTTIVTFLMVFLIQRSQNKEAKAVQLKLNEIVAALDGASNQMISIEDLGEKELDALSQQFRALLAASSQTRALRRPSRLASSGAAASAGKGVLDDDLRRLRK